MSDKHEDKIKLVGEIRESLTNMPADRSVHNILDLLDQLEASFKRQRNTTNGKRSQARDD